LRENTDFYPSKAIGIRHQVSPSACCRRFGPDGLMFLRGERHLHVIAATAGVDVERSRRWAP